MADELHHGIEFADRYALGIAQGNSDAATALYRLQTLANNIERVDTAIDLGSGPIDVSVAI